MKRSEAERLTSEYIKSIFGYAVKRCRTIQDAEGLLQEIALKIFRAFLLRDDISEAMGIPLGTVKWHLFEAKKELKRGMEMERKASELKFNPIIFDRIGSNGNVGEKGGSEIFLRSALAQNIVYLARNEEKKIAEMADSLGVSPVYAESEADFLEEYGFLIKRGNGYLSNEMKTENLFQMVPDQKMSKFRFVDQ